MNEFNPNNIGIANGNYFALPVQLEDAEIIIIPVPWDATVSYCQGTAKGPQAILDASLQIDLFDKHLPQAWNLKVASLPEEDFFEELNCQARENAVEVISRLEEGESPESLVDLMEKVNSASEKVNNYVFETALKYIKEGKKVVVLGGEHSVPLGLIKSLGEKYNSFGVLHIDAHADLREAYEGFKYSHASIMYNVLAQTPQVSNITQVGIRDFCDDENNLILKDNRLHTFFDFDLKEKKYIGKTWDNTVDEIISTLPDKVYISLDIDGLSPEFCPNTGTPVPGGLDFNEVDYLIYKLAKSGKEIIGFDLNEVAPSEDSEWDANVGARLLFKLLVYTQISKLNKNE